RIWGLSPIYRFEYGVCPRYTDLQPVRVEGIGDRVDLSFVDAGFVSHPRGTDSSFWIDPDVALKSGTTAGLSQIRLAANAADAPSQRHSGGAPIIGLLRRQQ